MITCGRFLIMTGRILQYISWLLADSDSQLRDKAMQAGIPQTYTDPVANVG
jgi:hypothetical protein